MNSDPADRAVAREADARRAASASAAELRARPLAATADRGPDRREAVRAGPAAPDQDMIPATTLPTGGQR